MIYPLSVRRENKYLADNFGYKQGKPWYQWRWGEDLTNIADVLDDFGKPIYDVHCACGINRSIHTDPRCNWSTLVPQKEKVCIVPRYAQRWVMSVWGPAPAYGFYLPAGDSEKTIAIVPDKVPTRDDTILVMAALAEYYSEKAAERMAKLREKSAEMERTSMDPDRMGSKQKALYQRLKDEAPVSLKDEYGRPTQFHGQTGVGESPTPSKLIIP